jgi:acetyl-CoA C-acetyltransferase
MEEIVILSGARTAIGTFGGSLANTPLSEVATHVTKAALERAGRRGQAGGAGRLRPCRQYRAARCLSVARRRDAGGHPDSAPAMNVNRLCGSGAQAVVSAMQALAMGDADFALAGGAEAMSRMPYIMPAARFGQKMGDTAVLDMMLGALTCPFGTGHMGVTAENVAAEHQITREEQDAFALESQNRAAAAIAEGRFKDQIVPFVLKTRKGEVAFETDEHPKKTTAEALAGLRPAFQEGRQR